MHCEGTSTQNSGKSTGAIIQTPAYTHTQTHTHHAGV